ncbi:TetR/AcrR family transcriptional regulator C-terminal domain-containing protein [Amycolatopsis cynarae]|uniref:TetR/AcrR family transcriptional regulator C-terminal domain-containing protein n=1 Tax=Amycolatopsis cynarae TaxID=2995223 RepID=A0ABY7AZ14_9PSEU|nr:TetR/AcrR family transcriptional regulator C-terminal domain-containing protein [Amycolatopsis sp. HUAS 11-8]WAL64955.1 TetR/AcrR family transcriptional regulator C-terminal domain-containing protein [Amycolatopsis sp. HUAS 11-8]
MPRPRSLTPAQIATAALAVLDRDGLEGLSMRTVAKELGVGTMSLYRYVTDRGQLEGLIVDQVLRTVPLDLPPRTSARERLVLFADRIRHAVGEHPGTVPLLLAHRHLSPASRQWGEAVLGVLAEAGISGRERVLTFRAYLSYVLGALQTDHFSPLSGPGTAALGELPEADFPFLAGAAREARHISAQEEFRHGLDLLLRGLGLP